LVCFHYYFPLFFDFLLHQTELLDQTKIFFAKISSAMNGVETRTVFVQRGEYCRLSFFFSLTCELLPPCYSILDKETRAINCV
jgi:hypothetical protein